MPYFTTRSAVSTLKTSHTTTSFVSSSLIIHVISCICGRMYKKAAHQRFCWLSKAEWSWPFSIQQKITIDLYICAFCCLEYMGMPIRSLCEMLKIKNFKMQFFTLFHSSPESRVFILVALARVNASNWFNIIMRVTSPRE